MNNNTVFNAADELLQHGSSSVKESKAAFYHLEKQLTYAELDELSKKMCGLLRQYDIRAESRVAMIVLDTLDFPVIYLGAIRSGVVPVPLNTLLTTEQYRYILNDSGAEAVFVSAQLLTTVESAIAGLDSVKHVFVCGGEPQSRIDFCTALNDSTALESIQTHRDSTAFWLYSSGSTGMPKGVPHVQTSMRDTAEHFAKGILGLSSNDTVYSAAKLFFAYGLGNALSFPLSVGASAVLDSQRPTPERVFENMQRYQPTVFFGAPTLFAAMLANESCTPANGSAALRLCVSAGEALPADIGQRWRDRFGTDIIDGVGSTEMLHIFLSNTPHGTSGVPVPGYDVRLVDENNNAVSDGQIGELLVKGTSAGEGYWNQREKSRQTFLGEWVRTGDKYTRDSDGVYTYAGRTDDMFKVSGQWVSPFEVESALITHPDVLEAAVVAATDEAGLLKPKAYVVLQQESPADALFDDLKSHVQDQVGKWKYPRWIVAVEALPKTVTGKIQRYKLRELDTDS